MIRLSAHLLLVFLAVTPPALADNSPRANAPAPILDFSLPTFTIPEGYRAMLIRGAEAWLTEPNIIDVKGLTLTIFSGDALNRADKMMLSPSAHILPDQQVITGDSTLRVIDMHDGFEATGEGWRYTNKEKTVTLSKNVRVVLQAEFKNLLK